MVKKADPEAKAIPQLSPCLPRISKHWRLGILALAFPSLAFAYIDPGTGAYVVQGVIALLGTVVFYVTHPRGLAQRVFGRFFKGRSSSDSE